MLNRSVFTLQCHQVHQWQAYSMETAEKEILHRDLYLDHVGEGVQGREGHVGVLRVQVRLVQRQSQLLRHTLVFTVVKKKKNNMEERSLI